MITLVNTVEPLYYGHPWANKVCSEGGVLISGGRIVFIEVGIWSSVLIREVSLIEGRNPNP